MFNKYRAFYMFNICNIEKNPSDIIFGVNNIIIASKTFLENANDNTQINKMKNTLNELKELKFDLIIFDRCDEYDESRILQSNRINSYANETTIKIYLLRDYQINELNIPLECQINWDVEDMYISKNCDLDKLKRKHKFTITNFENIKIKYYEKALPKMHFITNMFDNYTFNFDNLFTLNEENEFSDIKEFLIYISSIFTRINYI
jgi:hypothetical protein